MSNVAPLGVTVSDVHPLPCMHHVRYVCLDCVIQIDVVIAVQLFSCPQIFYQLRAICPATTFCQQSDHQRWCPRVGVHLDDV
jgi:hypothetical protein